MPCAHTPARAPATPSLLPRRPHSAANAVPASAATAARAEPRKRGVGTADAPDLGDGAPVGAEAGGGESTISDPVLQLLMVMKRPMRVSNLGFLMPGRRSAGQEALEAERSSQHRLVEGRRAGARPL